jgi:hypothetical protein
MKIGLGSPASYVFAVAFVVAPVTVALAVLLLTGGAGQSSSAKPYFLGLAVLSVAPGVLYLERMRRLQVRRMGQPPRPGAADAELRLAAVGVGCFVAAESFVVAFIDWRVAAGYFALVVAPSLPTKRSSRLYRACNLAPRFKVTPRRARESISSSRQPAAPGLSTHIDPSSRFRPRSSGSLCFVRRS